ncbi:MAG: amidohydrolase family protein [Firmicutes bacterium]|nr:amidohydrolase family protein [Bacillota bacterium]
MKERIDSLILHGDVFTMEGDGVGYIGDGAIAIADGKIVKVGASAELEEAFTAEEVIDGKDKMILPGFIDAHIHTSQTMMRGMAQDTSHWMMKGIEPLRYYIDTSDSIYAAKATVLEALATGTTTFGESATPAHIAVMDEFYHDLGVRTNFTAIIYGMRKSKAPDVHALYDLDEDQSRRSLEDNISLYEKWKNRSHRTTVNIGAHAPDTLSRDMLIQCKEVSNRLGLKINMHVAQGDRETEQMMLRYGKRSIPFLDEIGYLDENLIAIHLTEATEEETRLVAKKGGAMVVCSGSIGIIDGIVPPTKIFQDAGGMVALGTDQASGNNCNQIINEMKLTALFNKIQYRDPEVMPSWKALRMATIEGAKVLGLADRIGSLKAGKQADIVMVDLGAVTMMPIIRTPYRNMVPNLVHSARGNEVCRVMVDGKTLYLNGRYLTVDGEQILEGFRDQAKTLYEETQWGEEVKKAKGYQLQEKGYL